MSDPHDGLETRLTPSSSPPSGDVVHLRNYGHLTPERILRDMRDYWDMIRKGRAVPSRSDVDPRDITRLLDYSFILERIAPGAGRLRLAGRHLIDLMGMEVRGMPICAFFNTTSRGRLSDVLESVFKAPQIAQMTLHSPAHYARPELSGYLLILPLRSEQGDITRAVGCLATHSDWGVAPRRFDIATDTVLPIIQGGTTLSPSPSSGVASVKAPPHPTIAAQSVHTDRKSSARFSDATTPEQRRALFQVISAGNNT